MNVQANRTLRFLVTGATGFIGSHVVESLNAKGWEVVCPVRDTSSLRNLDPTAARVVSLDRLESEITGDGAVDYVIHVAGSTRALNYEGYRAANVDFARRLLDLFQQPAMRNGLKRFVLVSSQAAAGPSREDGTPVTEQDPPHPVSLYGRTKLEAEMACLAVSERLPITIIRPSTVFGPRDLDVLGVFKSAKYRIAAHIAGPNRLVSIIYVQDLVQGILAAAFSPAAVGQTYFIANPVPVVWREFSLHAARVMGYKAVALPVPLFIMRLVARAGDFFGGITGNAQLFRTEKLEEMKQIAWVCSAAKAEKELGWSSRTPMTDALEKTAGWYREHGWL